MKVKQGEMIQTGHRTAETVNLSLEQKAKEIGISKNSLINILIELGFKILDGEITVHHQGK